MKQFDGLEPITGARLEYVTGSESSAFREVTGFSATINGLIPFAYYNVTIFLRNRLGLSDPVTLVQQTDSDCKFHAVELCGGVTSWPGNVIFHT